MTEKSFSLTLDNAEKVAAQFINSLENHRKLAFYGSMGAGKTTFITALCKHLDATDLVSSPTFAIVNEYQTKTENTIFHFDFYRIENAEELYDIGFEEYTQDNAWCFIEWPEKAEELIPADFLKVDISISSDGSRLLQLHLPE